MTNCGIGKWENFFEFNVQLYGLLTSGRRQMCHVCCQLSIAAVLLDEGEGTVALTASTVQQCLLDIVGNSSKAHRFQQQQIFLNPHF